MLRRPWHLWAEDILHVLKAIQDYTQGMDRDGFIGDGKAVDAVVRNLSIIGGSCLKGGDGHPGG